MENVSHDPFSSFYQIKPLRFNVIASQRGDALQATTPFGQYIIEYCPCEHDHYRWRFRFGFGDSDWFDSGTMDEAKADVRKHWTHMLTAVLKKTPNLVAAAPSSN